MGIEDYVVLVDKFEENTNAAGFCFPCNSCKHNKNADDEAPCNACDHNCNSVTTE